MVNKDRIKKIEKVLINFPVLSNRVKKKKFLLNLSLVKVWGSRAWDNSGILKHFEKLDLLHGCLVEGLPELAVEFEYSGQLRLVELEYLLGVRSYFAVTEFRLTSWHVGAERTSIAGIRFSPEVLARALDLAPALWGTTVIIVLDEVVVLELG